MPLVTRRRPFRLDTIHPSVLGDTHSAWFGWKWVGTCRERVLFNRMKWGGALIIATTNQCDYDPCDLAAPVLA
jgi:hypothetical protein